PRCGPGRDLMTRPRRKLPERRVAGIGVEQPARASTVRALVKVRFFSCGTVQRARTATAETGGVDDGPRMPFTPASVSLRAAVTSSADCLSGRRLNHWSTKPG